MNLDRDVSSPDEYLVTALQIFDYCGSDSAGTLRVDALMDKFAPFVKTNKAEFSYLKSVLDPDQCNPDIDVTTLANALHHYSQKTKMDLDESFNLKGGQMPQDSDSGISTDGFHLVEELQCSLREKSHLAQQLRSQLDFIDRQHEEAIAAVTAERDALKAHLNLVREENVSLSSLRREYEEACSRACAAEEQARALSPRLHAADSRVKVLAEELAVAKDEKSTLQELLAKSKAECHRINEMYASRQSALLEQNESLRAERADLAARLQDQGDCLQHLIKEKVILEMELKEAVNKSNQTHLERSIDLSYTEDQMLTALDTLADTRFATDLATVATQAEVPCLECEKRSAVTPHRSLRKYLWEPLKCLFQAFAVVCFLCAVSVLYGVTRRWSARCGRDVSAVPWRWFDAQDVLDLLLRIEYVADVPM